MTSNLTVLGPREAIFLMEAGMVEESTALEPK